ncbi:murein biosynthesis integral membrane protein MurJ [Nocardioides houyundeii]|uniref:murein biosynthesis integral membrane protein MurJ n=1 Tax=Nocardioides houyundeii TaxID=2045452 RepID=UPI001F07BCE7|nr:murein biosynthesis integral membrane protein MurJ [Nocardioides houyundeii]
MNADPRTPTSEPTGAPTDEVAPEDAARAIRANSVVMAVGTVFSRLSGFIRAALLVTALGAGVRADVFALGNTIPNAIYILLAGGIFNAVLVPQLVRALKNDEDGGEGYTNRIITLAALFLGAVTLALVAAAPWVMELYLSAKYDTAALAEHKDSAIALARYCLPQVFFYGMFVLVGQVLNARGTFGPMMWAPIANNVIAVAVLVAYLVLYGRAGEVAAQGALSPGQEVLLGVGSTLGIVAQFLILLPFLRRSGFLYRPRFDFRGTGLGHTLRLGSWTVLFVVVNQIAWTVVVNLASSGPVSGEGGTGFAVYSYSMLIVMLPHAIVTVSLATAALPRLSSYAADGRPDLLARSLTSTLRTCLVVVVPFAALVPVLAWDIANVVYGFSDDPETVGSFVPSLRLFGIGLVLFTVHYLMLRGFYALERTRTVFFIQCAVAGTNVVAAVLLVREASAVDTSPALVIAYATAYLVGSVVSYAVLRRTLGGLDSTRMLRFAIRLVAVVALSTALAWLVSLGLDALGQQPNPLVSLGRGAVVGTVDLVALVLLARLFRLGEVGELVDPVLDTVRRRLPRR